MLACCADLVDLVGQDVEEMGVQVRAHVGYCITGRQPSPEPLWLLQAMIGTIQGGYWLTQHGAQEPDEVGEPELRGKAGSGRTT